MSNEHFGHPTFDEDAEALRAETSRATYGADRLRDVLETGRPDGGKPMLSPIKRHPKIVSGFAVLALAAILLFVPVSYSVTTGHRLTMTFSAVTPAEGKALAGDVRRALDARGVKVTMEGGMTRDKIFHVYVETDGKTDEEVESEILDQLEAAGVAGAEAEFDRSDDGSHLRIAGEKDGKRFELVREAQGGPDPGVIEMRHEPLDLDTEREPGMTDEELEAKIQKQLDDAGHPGTGSVNGDEIRIEVTKELSCTGGEDDPPECP